MASGSARLWKYATPAVVCVSVGMAAPMWYAVRLAGLSLLFAVASFIYTTLSLNSDLSEERVEERRRLERGVEPSKVPKKTPKQRLAPLRFAAAAFLYALCLLIPSVVRIINGAK